jgi:mannose-6-phosphate isomerase-like protein (cupin superfamily)
MTAPDTNRAGPRDCVLVCPDLDAALDFYTRQLGFRLDVIFPADNPRIAVLSGYGICVRLESESSPTTAPTPCPPSVIIQQSVEDSWGQGRAGMQYRDLIPGRLGGHFIASHIRIPDGGPVADYVHHHHVRFQMIYCHKGWVRVVYEDQGEPFTLRAGDCVLQPPHIRHRVLESSDGMEVIEVGCPAEHETRVDHEMALPTATVNRKRKFDAQQFVHHQVSGAIWLSGPSNCFETRDTGIGRATANLAAAVVLRSTGKEQTQVLCQRAEFLFNFVLCGSLSLGVPAENGCLLKADDCFVIPPDTRFVLSNISADLQLLQVTLPGM